MDTWRTAGRWWVCFFLWQFTAQERNTTLNLGKYWLHFGSQRGNMQRLVGYLSVCHSFLSIRTDLFCCSKIRHPISLFHQSSEQRIPLLKWGCCCCRTQSLMFGTRKICRVVSEVQQLHCDEYMAQRQCVREGALDICTLTIHSMWFSPSFVNELAWIYESRDVQGCMFAANCNNWIKDVEILMKYAQK